MSKSFLIKIKKLQSQNENYFFCHQTIKFNYAHKIVFSQVYIWIFRFWTFIFVHFSKFNKTFPQKKQCFYTILRVPHFFPTFKYFFKNIDNFICSCRAICFLFSLMSFFYFNIFIMLLHYNKYINDTRL